MATASKRQQKDHLELSQAARLHHMTPYTTSKTLLRHSYDFNCSHASIDSIKLKANLQQSTRGQAAMLAMILVTSESK